MTNINLKLIADNLEWVDDMWVAKSKSKISYPEKGNRECFQIEDHSFWFRHRNNCIIEVLRQFPPKGTFYDIGGGNGFVSKELVKNGIDAVILEPGANGVLNAKKRGLKNIICSTLENAGFKRNILPAIGLFDVVEHIEDDRKFLKLVFDYLELEGRLYITVPAFHLLCSKEDDAAGHFKRYSIVSMSKILAEIGFNVEYATYIFSILLIPIFLFRSLPSKLGVFRNSNFNEKHKKEHSEKGGITGKLIEKSFQTELARIKNKKKIPFGTSCLISAIRQGSAKVVKIHAGER